MKQLLFLAILILTGCTISNSSVLYHFNELRITADYSAEWKTAYLTAVEPEIKNYPETKTVIVFFLKDNQPFLTIKASADEVRVLLEDQDWYNFLNKAEIT